MLTLVDEVLVRRLTFDVTQTNHAAGCGDSLDFLGGELERLARLHERQDVLVR